MAPTSHKRMSMFTNSTSFLPVVAFGNDYTAGRRSFEIKVDAAMMMVRVRADATVAEVDSTRG